MARPSRRRKSADSSPDTALPAVTKALAPSAAEPDTIPVLTDDMAAVPILTDILNTNTSPDKRLRDPSSAARNRIRTRVDRDLRDRIAEQEARLQQTMAQLERVKVQAASVRDVLAAEQRNRHTLEEQVSELLINQRSADGAETGADSPDPPQSDVGGHTSRREMVMQLANLSDYVSCRKQWWQEMEALAESNRQRIRELEQEVAQRLRRETDARQAAEHERARAAELHANLIAASREIERLRRQLAESRHTRRPAVGQPVLKGT